MALLLSRIWEESMGPQKSNIKPTKQLKTYRHWSDTMHTTKVLALTTSSMVTPKSRLGSNVPALLKTSAAMGTVELTGLLIKLTIAFGQLFAIPSQRVLTIPALILNRSSLVIPGFRGTPAGMITRSMPVRASSSRACPKNPRT